MKFNARMILVLLVGIVALSYVVDFLNPLTPDPPAISNALQWRGLASFIGSIMALNVQRLVLVRLRLPSVEAVCSRSHGSPAAIPISSLILDLTCSRLI